MCSKSQCVSGRLGKLADYIMNPSNAKRFTSNIPEGYKKAISDLKQLCSNKKVVIAQADKSDAYVLIHSEKHISLILENLNSRDFIITNDESSDIHIKLCDWVEKYGHILSQEESNYIRNSDIKPGSVKFLYKSRKKGFSSECCPNRLITKACGSTLETLSKWLHFHMMTMAQSKKFRLNDSKQTLRKLFEWSKQLKNIPDNLYLLSFDIVKFYPSVDFSDFNRIIKLQLTENPELIDQKLIEPIIETSEICAKNSSKLYRAVGNIG